MYRMRPGKFQPVYIAFLIPLAVIIAACVFVVARREFHKSRPQFDTIAYNESPEKMRGNHYNLDAQIESKLAMDEGFGKILAVKPIDGSSRLPVFVPDSVASDLYVGQRFHMTVLVKDQGLIQAESLDKY